MSEEEFDDGGINDWRDNSSEPDAETQDDA